jgi:uncharacterized protein YpmS
MKRTIHKRERANEFITSLAIKEMHIKMRYQLCISDGQKHFEGQCSVLGVTPLVGWTISYLLLET